MPADSTWGIGVVQGLCHVLFGCFSSFCFLIFSTRVVRFTRSSLAARFLTSCSW